jgi:hypothetical protein
MTPNATGWIAPPLSTTNVEATMHYRDGIAAVVAGLAHADRVLATALVIEPTFFLADVGLAVTRAVRGGRYVAPEPSGTVSRPERQHAEVVRTFFTGDCQHASDLRREHLLEFPGDVLIVWLPTLRRCRPHV